MTLCINYVLRNRPYGQNCTISFVGTMNSFPFHYKCSFKSSTVLCKWMRHQSLKLWVQSRMQLTSKCTHMIYFATTMSTWWTFRVWCCNSRLSAHFVQNEWFRKVPLTIVSKASVVCFKSKRGTFVPKWWDILLLFFKRDWCSRFSVSVFSLCWVHYLLCNMTERWR